MMQDTTIPTDLILSSGYCAFARQVGVLSAVEDLKIPIDRSVAASLYCRYVVTFNIQPSIHPHSLNDL